MANVIEAEAFFKLSYGLFVLSGRYEGKDNGCIINTAIQLTDLPKRVSIAVNKTNYTHDVIMQSRKFNLSVLNENAPFELFKRFGFVSGRQGEKFTPQEKELRSANGLIYIDVYANAVISGVVSATLDCGTHTLFIADVSEAFTLNNVASATYAYYFTNIKPRVAAVKKAGYICQICSYVYDGDVMPTDFVCPICGHGPDVFRPL